MFLISEKSFQVLIKLSRNQIVFTIFQLIWNQMDPVRMVPNQSENGKYYIQRNLFKFLLNQTDIRLYLPFSN